MAYKPISALTPEQLVQRRKLVAIRSRRFRRKRADELRALRSIAAAQAIYTQECTKSILNNTLSQGKRGCKSQQSVGSIEPEERRPFGPTPVAKRVFPVISREDLADPERIEKLRQTAIKAGYVRDNFCDKLWFYTAARHALTTIAKSAGALFVWLITRNQRAKASQAAEDWASNALKGLLVPMVVQTKKLVKSALRPILAISRKTPMKDTGPVLMGDARLLAVRSCKIAFNTRLKDPITLAILAGKDLGWPAERTKKAYLDGGGNAQNLDRFSDQPDTGGQPLVGLHPD